MKTHWPLVVASVLTLVTADSALAKHYRHHARAPDGPAVAAQSFAAPHMIEARPGVFISSYGCITDEGYGRWLYCGQGRR
jgi:hypothetical protein